MPNEPALRVDIIEARYKMPFLDVLAALYARHNSLAGAARELGLSYQHLYTLMLRYSISKKDVMIRIIELDADKT